MTKTLPPDRRTLGRKVITPAGIFPNATKAAEAHGMSRQLAHKYATEQWHGFRFVESQEAYAERIARARQLADAKRSRAEQSRAAKAHATDMLGKAVGSRLWAWRQRHNLSRSMAADILQVSMRNIEMWELGRPCRSPDDVLARMERASL
jgi:DNA-binding transcriptional regulator YiaG